jgi:hypothetical protein
LKSEINPFLEKKALNKATEENESSDDMDLTLSESIDRRLIVMFDRHGDLSLYPKGHTSHRERV